jgi:hypothetical protein
MHADDKDNFVSLVLGRNRVSDQFILTKPHSKDYISSFQNQRPPAAIWGYEDGPWKEPGPPLLGAADF